MKAITSGRMRAMGHAERVLIVGGALLFFSSLAAAAMAQQSPPDAPAEPAPVLTPPPVVSPAAAPIRPAIKYRDAAPSKESLSSKRRKPAKGQRGTLTGARLIPFRAQAIRATFGFPDIELAYHFPYSPEIELIPRLQIAYGRNLSTEPNFMEAGTDARKEIKRKGRWTVAGIASTFLHLNMNEKDKTHRKVTGAFGIGLGCPGVVVTYALKRDIDLNFGVQLQPILYLDSDPSIELNIPFSLGFEIALGKTVVLLQRTEFGPDIYLGERIDLQLRTYLGVGYYF